MHYEKQENTQANILLKSSKQIQYDILNFYRQKPNDSNDDSSKDSKKDKESASDVEESVLTSKDSSDLKTIENVPD